MILVTRLVQVKEFDLGLNADELVEEKAMHLWLLNQGMRN